VRVSLGAHGGKIEVEDCISFVAPRPLHLTIMADSALKLVEFRGNDAYGTREEC
jgi:hypothetical protein